MDLLFQGMFLLGHPGATSTKPDRLGSRSGDAGIVYCLSRNSVEKTATS